MTLLLLFRTTGAELQASVAGAGAFAGAATDTAANAAVALLSAACSVNSLPYNSIVSVSVALQGNSSIPAGPLHNSWKLTATNVSASSVSGDLTPPFSPSIVFAAISGFMPVLPQRGYGGPAISVSGRNTAASAGSGTGRNTAGTVV